MQHYKSKYINNSRLLSMGCFQSDTRPKTQGVHSHSMPGEVQEAMNFAINRNMQEGLIAQIELHLSCANLKNMDTISLTDSVCVVSIKDNK